jgi:uroporphyrinogen III methyltransferase/synthase
MSASKGFVSIVGAGPGDPELISVLGARRLAEADVVLYDRLVDPEILRYAGSQADLVDVGKTSGSGGEQQQAITALMVDLAKAGKRVVRLKGGDPFVFGRGAEEALALAEEGIPFEIVPGITSAVAAAAYAGIPLTHRELSRGFAVITGRVATGEAPKEEVDWESLARFKGTLVFLMAAETLSEIVASLLGAGKPSDVPAAIVEWATYSRQRCLEAPLSDIVDAANKAEIRAPAVLIVGDAVSLRERIRWFEKRPLYGRGVLVTRPRERSSDLARALKDLGAEVVLAPAIEPTPFEDDPKLEDVIERARGGGFSWIAFASPTGVESFFAALVRAGGDARALAGTKIAAVGPTTAAALEAKGLAADFVPKRSTAEALAHDLPLGYKAEPVLVVQARSGRPELARVLSERGFDVEVVEAYESRRPRRDDPEVERVDAELDAGRIDAVLFASSSQVESFVDVFGIDRMPPAVICIGPTTAETCRKVGLEPTKVAASPTVESLVEAVVEALGPRNRRTSVQSEEAAEDRT